MVLVVKCLICQAKLEYNQSDPSELIRHVKSEHPTLDNNNNKRKNKTFEREEIVKEKAEKAVGVNFRENSNLRQFSQTVQTELMMSDIQKMSACKCDGNKLKSELNDYKPLTSEVKEKKTQKDRISEEYFESDEEDDGVKEIFNNKTQFHHNKSPNNNHLVKQDCEKEKLLKHKKHVKFYKTSIERWRPVGDETIHCPRCQSNKRPIIRTKRQHVTSSSLASSFIMACWPFCLFPCYLPAPKFENLHCSICNFHLGIFDHQKKTVISNPRITNDFSK